METRRKNSRYEVHPFSLDFNKHIKYTDTLRHKDNAQKYKLWLAD